MFLRISPSPHPLLIPIFLQLKCPDLHTRFTHLNPQTTLKGISAHNLKATTNLKENFQGPGATGGGDFGLALEELLGASCKSLRTALHPLVEATLREARQGDRTGAARAEEGGRSTQNCLWSDTTHWSMFFFFFETLDSCCKGGTLSNPPRVGVAKPAPTGSLAGKVYCTFGGAYEGTLFTSKHTQIEWRGLGGWVCTGT